MKNKIRVGILFGGKSAEHEISILSAKNIAKELDPALYETVLIWVNKQGKWHLSQQSKSLSASAAPELSDSSAKQNDSLDVNQLGPQLLFVPGESSNQIQVLSSSIDLGSLDVVIPVIHGPYGEDGAVQGLLKLANIPFVGASVLGSAVGMDKDVMKRLLRDAGIKTAKFKAFTRGQKQQINYEQLQAELGVPMYVKPANLGSSVGISKVKNQAQLQQAIELAFKYDRKIVIEQNIVGRELECALLGNEDVQASLPGELLSVSDQHEFYSYDAKYLDENGAAVAIPANLSQDQIKKIQTEAIKAYKVLNCEGLARVDMFFTDKDEVIINEINTLPGFTNVSMFPKLWQVSGKSYSELLAELINLAIQRHQEEAELLSTV